MRTKIPKGYRRIYNTGTSKMLISKKRKVPQGYKKVLTSRGYHYFSKK